MKVVNLKLITGESILCNVVEYSENVIRVGMPVVFDSTIEYHEYGCSTIICPRLYSTFSDYDSIVTIPLSGVVSIINVNDNSRIYLEEVYRYLIGIDAKHRLSIFDGITRSRTEDVSLLTLSPILH